MKILILSDLHNSEKILFELRKFLENHQFDFCLIAGDLTNSSYSAITYIKNLEELFKQHSLDWQCVHGNNDPPEVIQYLKKIHKNLHYAPYQKDNYQFIGIGGWGNELPPYHLETKDAILVTHIPPRTGINPKKLNQATQPQIHISGHIHYWSRVTDINHTRIINVPAALHRKGAILTLPDKEVEFIEF